MRRLIAAFAALAVFLMLAATAEAAYGPIDEPGPPLSVPKAKLAAALNCTKGVTHASRAPVLLVPGTGSTPPDNFGWNYEPALNTLHIPWCAVTLPNFANSDIQVAGEYVVYGIRTMHHRAGRRIAIIGHSQGGMVPRWALRWWPDTRAMVDDMIGFAPTNHGTTAAKNVCQSGCSPADMQQENTSHFIAALNSRQETFPGISYTDVYTHFDEEVQPNMDSHGSSSLHGGGGWITNVAVQDVCPTDHVEHLGIGTYDPVAYALAVDALDHHGPADPKRISQSVCTQAFMPGVNPVTGPSAGVKALTDDETSPSTTVKQEPPLKCYVTAGCASQRRALCARPVVFRLHPGRGRRVVEVVVYMNGRRVKRLHGHAIITVRVRLRGGTRSVRLVASGSRGTRQVIARRYHACDQLRPR